MFIDETGANTKMARLHGRARRGERLRAAIPHGHWKTIAFVGALRLTGMTAPMVLDGPMTGEWFLAYTEQVPVPAGYDAVNAIGGISRSSPKVAGCCWTSREAAEPL